MNRLPLSRHCVSPSPVLLLQTLEIYAPKLLEKLPGSSSPPVITNMLAPAMVDSLVSCAVSFLAGTALCVCSRPYLQCGSSLVSCLLCAFDLSSGT